MNQKRGFLLLNLTLIAVSGGMIYLLATATYSRPSELDDVQVLLDRVQENRAGSVRRVTIELDFPYLNEKYRNFMRALFTLTPTPPPTPPPTPTPIPLATVLSTWAINSMDETSVLIVDGRTNEEFELSIGSPARRVEYQGTSRFVTLCGANVDVDPPEATFCSDEEKVTKNFVF